jgi:hypothetical protein
MSLKKYHLLLGFSILFAISFSMIFMTGVAVADSKAAPNAAENVIGTDVSTDAEAEKLSTSAVSGGLQVGDLIFKTNPKMIIIPGTYKHVQIYIGNSQVVESDPSGGVHYSATSTGARVERVSTSSTVKTNAANWAKTKVGLKYDYNLVTKQLSGSTWYCSELTWAAYKNNGGPDIDKNPGYNIVYQNAVAPQEEVDDADTYYIGSF